MASRPSLGVCILRVEPQTNYLLITVTANRYIGTTLTSTEPDLTTKCTDADEALRVVERFLRTFRGMREV